MSKQSEDFDKVVFILSSCEDECHLRIALKCMLQYRKTYGARNVYFEALQIAYQTVASKIKEKQL